MTSDKLTSLSLGVLICRTGTVVSALVLFYFAQILKAHGRDVQHRAKQVSVAPKITMQRNGDD